MKKILFGLFVPTIILPLSLFSCSQNSNNNDLNNAKKEVERILELKPKPKLKNQPTSDASKSIQLITSYLDTKSYFAPEGDFKFGIKITVEWIEFPINNESDLTIWLKIDSSEYFGEEISKSYSIKFKDILSLSPSITLLPISEVELKDVFIKLIENKKGSFADLMNDAINGEKNFSGMGEIKPEKYELELPKLLTSENINNYIFQNYQRNIQMEYSIKNKIDEHYLLFTFYLGGLESEIKTPLIQLEIKGVK